MMMPDDDAIIKSIKTLSDIIKVKVETEKFEEKLEKNLAAEKGGLTRNPGHTVQTA